MIGFDIGGTKCSVSVGRNGKYGLVIENKYVIPTNHTVSPYRIIDTLCEAAEKMTDDFSKIGISCGGPLDSKRGVILSPPNLPGWNEVKIVDYLKDKYGGSAALQNDANACAVAEWKYGAGKGCDNMIFLTFGSGLGAGLILNGELYTGANDMAGEVGHIRLNGFGPVGYGKSGSFEGFCSGGGIKQLAQSFALEKLQSGESVSYCNSILELEQIDAKKVAESANAGNKDAQAVFSICGEMLGKGLSVLVDILNPEKIVIGSIYQRCEHLLSESMQRVMAKECLLSSYNACKVVPAALGDNIGDYAALAVAMINGKETKQ